MELIKNISKLFLPLIASGGIAISAIASEGSLGKPMQIFRFKTPQMVLYVNSTVSLLNSQENPNKRHLKNLKTCQKLFSSGKNLIRGMEIKTLKICKSYMTTGLYQKSSIEDLENELETLKQLIKFNNENQNLNQRQKEKELKESQEEELKEFQEKQLKELKDRQEKELKEFQEKQLKESQEKQLEEKIIKKESNLLFD